MTKTLFARIRWGFQNLFSAIGPNHPRVTAVRILQQHLIENLNDPAARKDILKRINQLSLELTGKGFNRFCQQETSTPSTLTPETPEPEPKETAPQTYDKFVQWLQPLLDQDRLKLPTIRKFVQARTITILKNINPTHKGPIVQFLYDAALLFVASYSISLADADLSNANLVEADIGGINLAEANLAGANIVGAVLTQATFTLTNLTGANLGWSIMPGSNLVQAELAGAILTGADLRTVDLTNANLVKATLRQADLTQCLLNNVNLLGANLDGVILTQANLTNAKLLWTDLSNARLDGATLTNVMYNQHTQWPRNYDPQKHGALKID